MTVAAHNTSA